MRKGMRAVWAAGAVLALAVMSGGCPKTLQKTVKPPTVTIQDVGINGISTARLDLVLTVEIDNPNPIGLTLSGVDYQLELAGRPLANGATTSAITLAASGKSRAEVPLSLAYREVEAIYTSAQGQDQLPYRVTGKVRIKTPLGDLPIPFETKGMLPVIRPPRVDSVDVHVDSLSLAGAKLTLSLNLFNPNIFSLLIKEFEYNLVLENQKFSSGTLRDQKLPAKGPGALTIPITIDFMSAGNWAYSLISKGQAQYALTYQAVYLLDNRRITQKEEKKGVLEFGK